jgi:spoIIIJ-associated protein
MNPYERRIIHTAVQDIQGVASWSVGEEPNRRVVIGVDSNSQRSNFRGTK